MEIKSGRAPGENSRVQVVNSLAIRCSYRRPSDGVEKRVKPGESRVRRDVDLHADEGTVRRFELRPVGVRDGGHQVVIDKRVGHIGAVHGEAQQTGVVGAAQIDDKSVIQPDVAERQNAPFCHERGRDGVCVEGNTIEGCDGRKRPLHENKVGVERNVVDKNAQGSAGIARGIGRCVKVDDGHCISA